MSTFADACQFGAACVCVARRGCPAASLCKCSLALLVARPLAELEKKIATRSGMCPVSAASC